MKVERKIKGRKVSQTIVDGRIALKIDGIDAGIQRDSDSKRFGSEILPYQEFDDPMKLARKLIESGWPASEGSGQ